MQQEIATFHEKKKKKNFFHDDEIESNITCK